MTSRDFNLAYLAHPYLPKADGNRREQLEALVERAQARLLVADQSAQPMAIRTASHFLIACEALLNRWLDRRNHDDEETSEEEGKVPVDPVEYEAMLRLLQSDQAISDKFQTLIQEIQNQ
jgi:hypothetical protein